MGGLIRHHLDQAKAQDFTLKRCRVGRAVGKVAEVDAFGRRSRSLSASFRNAMATKTRRKSTSASGPVTLTQAFKACSGAVGSGRFNRPFSTLNWGADKGIGSLSTGVTGDSPVLHAKPLDEAKPTPDFGFSRYTQHAALGRRMEDRPKRLAGLGKKRQRNGAAGADMAASAECQRPRARCP
jgi:hypothetical protein